MNRIPPVFIFLIILSYPLSIFAQSGPDPKKLLDAIGRNANAYFLSANRPSYGVSAYILDKGSYEISIDPSFNNDWSEVPLTFSYGLSNKVQLFTGINVFSQTYRFDGQKISGMGDANIGIAFMFQESTHFTHVLQALIKIPTASASQQVGTGHPDYHFGVAEGYQAKVFGYELSFEIGFLHRRNIPTITNVFFTQSLLDSIKTYYNYKFEPELTVSLTPSVNFSKKFMFYTGLSFSRNTKLDYNSIIPYAGLIYTPSEVVGLTAGFSRGIEKESNWLISTGLSFTFR